MDLGKILKEERVRKGLTQQALAKTANVTERAISYWESGKRKMNLDSADKVFKVLNITVTLGANTE